MMKSGDDLITLDEAAARLRGITVKTLKRRLAEAGIRGIKPGRERLLSEADYKALVVYLEQRAGTLAPRTPPVPSPLRRRIQRAATKRLLQGVRRGPVTSMMLERDK
jgi:excisionase family DNA binding protein